MGVELLTHRVDPRRLRRLVILARVKKHRRIAAQLRMTRMWRSL